MKDPIFKIEIFNKKKEIIDKLDYLLYSLDDTDTMPVKQFTESENNYDKRIKKVVEEQFDFDKTESKDMKFMLGLIKKLYLYNDTIHGAMPVTVEDIIISEYQSYINNKVLFTTDDGVDMKVGSTYYFIGKKWIGADESIIDVTINEKFDINRKATHAFGIKENAQKELDKKDVYKYISQLESETFEGWSEDSINGYLTACKSIKEKIKQIKNDYKNSLPL